MIRKCGGWVGGGVGGILLGVDKRFYKVQVGMGGVILARVGGRT